MRSASGCGSSSWVDLKFKESSNAATEANARYERLARRRRRRPELLLGSGSNPVVGSSVYRSIRIAGRMITVADSDLQAIDLAARPVRSTGRKPMIVPISLSPAPSRPDAVARLLPDLRGARLTVRYR